MEIKLVKGVKLEDLVDELKDKLQILNDRAYVKGIPFIVTCTGRSYFIQKALYAQGRETLGVVNKLRKEAGLWIIGKTDNKYKVTWTMKSKHIITSVHPKSEAFDLAVLKNNKPTWDIKADVNDNEINDYMELAYIGKEIGLKPGAFWGSPDYPHYEI